MDYVVGSVAALISGNVTPNRPKLMRKALTPIKHQQSPNVTPKSELEVDRSIFLSPSIQKKKAIIKKSPKRIFQNPDLDVTSEAENNDTQSSPKAKKVKKHLQEDLEEDKSFNKSTSMLKFPKNKCVQSKKTPNPSLNILPSSQKSNENTPKKIKRNNAGYVEKNNTETEINSIKKTVDCETENKSDVSTEEMIVESPKKNNKKKKKKRNQSVNKEQEQKAEGDDEVPKDIKNNKKVNTVNPNAITTQDSDSEHESDDEIVSENEEANKDILDTGPVDESSDEEETKEKEPVDLEKEVQKRTEDEVKRTLFVGNVSFGKKCKKDMKKIFSKYGDIETVRIRTIPVKDARVTPKLAVIKNELHPERSTVNVYIKYKDAASVEKALVENNTVLNECHLRVTRSDHSGAEHDPRCAVFVGNVPFAIEDDTLRDKFLKCGEIESVRIIRDKKTNAGKGFAYVNFASKDGVELALALTEEDLTIKNRILRVKRCTLNTNKQKSQARDIRKFPVNNQGRNVQERAQFGRKGGFQPRGQGPENRGAARRLMNKREYSSQDGGEGPSNKSQRPLNQPHKEKKMRKEFVGMTAEKKKKHTFNKGLKKKKALSEILNKF